MKSLSQLLNEGETKTPAQMEMEHKDTAEWFAEELASLLSGQLGTYADDGSTWDVKKATSELLPEYFNRIVKDHTGGENKDYYKFLVWMEDNMKKYKTFENFINKVSVND